MSFNVFPHFALEIRLNKKEIIVDTVPCHLFIAFCLNERQEYMLVTQHTQQKNHPNSTQK